MALKRLPRTPQSGFTVVEMVVVLVLVGVLASLALPRFVTLSEDAQTSQAESVNGAIGSAVQLAHAKWFAQGAGGATVALEGAVVDVNALGWPSQAGAPPMTEAGCLALWNGLLNAPPPATTGYDPDTPGWGALAGAPLCGWIYEPDVVPLRAVIYDSPTGRVWLIVI